MVTIVPADTQTDWVKKGNSANFLVALNSGPDKFRYEILAALLADEMKGFELKAFEAYPTRQSSESSNAEAAAPLDRKSHFSYETVERL